MRAFEPAIVTLAVYVDNVSLFQLQLNVALWRVRVDTAIPNDQSTIQTSLISSLEEECIDI